MKAAKLDKIIVEAGYETRSYRGRGMYGDSCVAFEVENGDSHKAVAEIMLSYAINLDWIDDEEAVVKLEELASAFGSMKVDNLGRDSIVLYFPKEKL